MKMFSLKWFKSERKKELELSKKIVKEDDIPPIEEVERSEKPFIGVRLVNNVLTVILKDGKIKSKTNSSKEDFDKILDAMSYDDILKVISSNDNKEIVKEEKKKKKTIEEIKEVVSSFGILSKLNDFTIVDDKKVYLTGTSRSIPDLLVKKFIKVIGKYKDKEVSEIEELLLKDDKYISLKRFFLWCSLASRPEVVEQLYGFLQKNGLKLTKQGLFVALRNVVTITGVTDNELVAFISNTYNKIKAVWKKKPSDFVIYRTEEDNYKFCKISDFNKVSSNSLINNLGNLEALYKDLPNMKENRYTDDYTKTFDIRIGKVVSMDPAKCSWSKADCAEAGLHFAGSTAPYILCGNTTVFTLHNPMKVVGIGDQKGRCYEYLPFMITNVKEANQIMRDSKFDFLQLDEAYAIEELEQLSEKIKAGFVPEKVVHNFDIPAIPIEEATFILSSLEEMKSELSSRVVTIKR